MAAPPIIVVETQLGAYGRRVLVGVAAQARRLGWHVLDLGPFGDGAAARLRQLRPAGAIVQCSNAALLQRYRALAAPVVNVSGVLRVRLPTVRTDEAAVGRLAAEHLLAHGHRRLAAVHNHSIAYSTDRVAGFRAAGRAAGAEVAVMDMSRAGIPALDAWTRALRRPCGVFWGLWSAERMLDTCRAAGLRVPEDLAFVGVDDDPWRCVALDPPLSGVDFPAERVGEQAAALLARLIAGQAAPRRPLLVEPVGVTVRASSGSWATADPLVAQALRLIHERAAQPLDVADLAARLPVSRRTLERRFLAALGRSPAEELQRARLAIACRLLAETQLPLREVARRAGLRRAQQLCRVFRERLGATPVGWRTRHATAWDPGAGAGGVTVS